MFVVGFSVVDVVGFLGFFFFLHFVKQSNAVARPTVTLKGALVEREVLIVP